MLPKEQLVSAFESREDDVLIAYVGFYCCGTIYDQHTTDFAAQQAVAKPHSPI